MEQKTQNAIAGWMILGLVVVGILGLFTGILSFVNEYDYVGTGLCLLASGFAFGKVLSAYQSK